MNELRRILSWDITESVDWAYVDETEYDDQERRIQGDWRKNDPKLTEAITRFGIDRRSGGERRGPRVVEYTQTMSARVYFLPSIEHNFL